MPYYNSYVAPYVDLARPYANQIQSQVIDPTVGFGKKTYGVYGAPKVEKVRAYVQQNWDKTLKPQVQAVRAQAVKHYDASIAPHMVKASEMAEPYYSASRDNMVHAYNGRVLPAYEASRPYAEKTYLMGHKAVVETGYPYAQWIWTSSFTFLNGIIWPRVRVLYGENVEPQLVRISERLGRYRDGQKIKAVLEEVDR